MHRSENMTNEEIIMKVEMMVIQQNPLLSSPDYRKRMSWIQKMVLVEEMKMIALDLQQKEGTK